MGTLDLSRLESAPEKVKLRDGKLYDMVPPEGLGARSLQRIFSRKQRAEELVSKLDPSEDEIAEMVDLMIDVCEGILPDAPREEIGKLGFLEMETLANHFLNASPAQAAVEEATSDA